MDFKRLDHLTIVRLDRGEEIFNTLYHLCLNENLKFGQISGIGAVENVELSFYDLKNKEYVREIFPEIYELVSLSGNLSILDQKPYLHLHGVITDEDYRAFGGHFFKATCSVTCELFIQHYELDVTRTMNQDVGLKLLDFRCGENHK